MAHVDFALASAYLLGVCVALAVLRVLHASEGGPNDTFEAARRSPLLRVLFPVWAVAMAAIVLVTWALRVDRLATVLGGPSPWAEKAALVVLIACEAVVLLYWLAYVRYCGLESRARPLPVAEEPGTPRVLVLIPACDEPASTLERAVGSAVGLDWVDARLVVVDNSRTEAGHAVASEVCARHGVQRLVVANRGSKAAALNDAADCLADPAPVLVVLDADQRARADLLRVLVPRLLVDDRLAFVQSAQGYEDAGASLVTRAAAQQEMLLYDAIAGGRGALGRAPCCGTNFVMRTAALAEVGGWDESTLAEDQVTSFLLHRAGWRSAYHRQMLAIGLGPRDLAAYWRQQSRWAHGATRMGLLALRRGAPAGVLVDTLWSSGFYALTLVLAVLGALPVALALAGPSASVGHPWLAISVYPLYALVMAFPYLHMWLRGYRLRDLLLVQGLLAVSVHVYARAVGAALLGRDVSPLPTPRGVADRRPSWWASPPAWTFAALLAVGPVLALQAVHGRSFAAAIPSGWAALAAVSVGHFFLFRRAIGAPPERFG